MIKAQFKRLTEYVSLIGRVQNSSVAKAEETNSNLNQLVKKGFVVLDHLVGSSEFQKLKEIVDERIEQDFDLQFPCLAQSLIDGVRDVDLIENNFLATDAVLKDRGLTFEKKDIKSYKQMLEDFAPSTLTLPMPNDVSFYNVWLDPKVISIVEGYMGFKPYLAEAYIRRNFPCNHKVTNFNWHRDANHEHHLLKAFIFFTDCDIETGAHHYISGSLNDPRFRDKTYFTDDEIHKVWPTGSSQHMTSTVPAGTIILEDTRGLHKAGVPSRDYRDLGFAVFIPFNFFKKSQPLYRIKRNLFDQLRSDQKKYIPSKNIL